MKKGISLAFLIILIRVDLSMAISWKVPGNHSHKGCGGGGGAAVEDCLIGNNWEAEFTMDSHTARMLYQLSQSVTGRSPNPNQAAVNCPISQRYRGCLPPLNGGAPRQPCGTYNRNC